MSYVLGVILGLSLINTIFLVNNLKTHTENKKQLDNLYNFTIHNIEHKNDNNEKQDINHEKQESSINQIELSDSVSQGIPQWSFLNLGKTLKQKSKNSSLSLSKIE